jgi:hypothetical protein
MQQKEGEKMKLILRSQVRSNLYLYKLEFNIFPHKEKFHNVLNMRDSNSTHNTKTL